jgi:hypothetical protein
MSLKVCELAKNSREKVVFSLSEFKDKHYLDMRLYLVGENSGPDVPTKKGLTISLDLYPKFKEALALVEAALITRGLMDKDDLEVQGE